MPLHIANRMFVVTSSGEREIQLCIGDLTTLPKEEKVDVVMVSAFPSIFSVLLHFINKTTLKLTP